MRKTDLAYIAGIIDGEGSISIIHASPRRRNPGGEIYAQVGVTNTNEWLIQWLHFNFGGGVNMEKAGRNPLSKQNIWRWNLSHQKARTFLVLILPYLRIKRQEAELAILHQKSKSKEQRVVREAQAILQGG